jgi:hypothetical protein
MTLDVYSGLFDADLDSVAVQLDSLPGVTGVSPSRSHRAVQGSEIASD